MSRIRVYGQRLAPTRFDAMLPGLPAPQPSIPVQPRLAAVTLNHSQQYGALIRFVYMFCDLDVFVEFTA